MLALLSQYKLFAIGGFLIVLFISGVTINNKAYDRGANDKQNEWNQQTIAAQQAIVDDLARQSSIDHKATAKYIETIDKQKSVSKPALDEIKNETAKIIYRDCKPSASIGLQLNQLVNSRAAIKAQPSTD